MPQKSLLRYAAWIGWGFARRQRADLDGVQLLKPLLPFRLAQIDGLVQRGPALRPLDRVIILGAFHADEQRANCNPERVEQKQRMAAGAF
jgi:hypothetical protein